MSTLSVLYQDVSTLSVLYEAVYAVRVSKLWLGAAGPLVTPHTLEEGGGGVGGFRVVKTEPHARINVVCPEGLAARL